MTEPTTVAGLAMAACAALAAVVRYLFQEWNQDRERWNNERKQWLTEIKELQTARVADAQRQGPDELLRLTREGQRVLAENARTSEALAGALNSLREGIEDLPEEVVRSVKRRERGRDVEPHGSTESHAAPTEDSARRDGAKR